MPLRLLKSKIHRAPVTGEPGSGEICIMHAAAYLVKTGNLVIIMAFADLKQKELANFQPKIVMIDQNNRTIKK